jgi:hypothetical protein
MLTHVVITCVAQGCVCLLKYGRSEGSKKLIWNAAGRCTAFSGMDEMLEIRGSILEEFEASGKAFLFKSPSWSCLTNFGCCDSYSVCDKAMVVGGNGDLMPEPGLRGE